MSPITVHVYHHFSPAAVDAKLDDIVTRLIALQQHEGVVMSKLDELEAELVAANATTNEIAADIDDLLAKLGQPGLSAAEADQVKMDLQALGAQLKAVAEKHTP